jgi:integrase
MAHIRLGAGVAKRAPTPAFRGVSSASRLSPHGAARSDCACQLLHQLQYTPLLLVQGTHQPAQFPHLGSIGAMQRAGLHDAPEPLGGPWAGAGATVHPTSPVRHRWPLAGHAGPGARAAAGRGMRHGHRYAPVRQPVRGVLPRIFGHIPPPGKAPASIKRYAASIAAYHRAAQAPNPLALKIATDALKRMARAHGERQRQAKGINDNLVVRMLAAAGNRLVDLRNKALLTVSYTTLCRRSELVRLLVEDLQADSDAFGSIVVRKGKTDQTGKGVAVAITADAMHHLRTWLTAARIERGPMFRSVNRHGHVGGRLNQ